MTWINRLRPKIKLVSPDGNEFEAFWRESDREITKKLGVFDYPGVRGSVVQDLEASSDRYSIPFSFAGPDHDDEAFRFMLSCRERGQWSVTHPFEGFLGLQLVSITKVDRPIEAGNITNFTSEWIEPIDENTLQTASELAGLVGNQYNNLNIGSASQFANNIDVSNAALKFSVTQTVGKIINAVNKVLGPISELNDAVFSSQLAIQRGIQDTLFATVFKPLSLAGQIQNLIQGPSRSLQDIKSRLSAYGSLASEMFGLSPSRPTTAGKNVVATQELALSAVIAANALISVTGPQKPDVPVIGGLQSRAQAVGFAVDLRDRFIEITDNLDLTQKLFEDEDIDYQYFSQSESFTDAFLLTTTAQRYFLLSAYNLNVEKRFRLRKPKTPLQIVGEEYGSFGDNADELIDLFIYSNNLRDTEILFLPAGREVLVYA